MPRIRRIQLPGGIYHIIGRGIERRKIFLDDEDRGEFMVRLDTSLKQSSYQCFAWALLSNHFHLLVRSGEQPLSKLMSPFLSGYAGYFNRRHKRVGHVFQNRFKSILCQEDAYLLELVRYIHLNPLRAKLVNNLKELGIFVWSGHSCLIGKKVRDFQNTEEILCHFGQQKNKAIAKYQSFIEDGLSMGRRSDLTGGGLIRSVGGWKEAAHKRKVKERWKGDERILGDSDFVNAVLKAIDETEDERSVLSREGWNMDQVIAKITEKYSLHKTDLLKKGRNNNISRAKALICYFCVVKLGYSLTALSDRLGISSPAIGKNVRLGEELVKNNKLDLSGL